MVVRETLRKQIGSFDGYLWRDTIDTNLGQDVDIDAWVQCTPEAWINAITYPLGIKRIYFNQYNEESCEYYYPFTEWDVATFDHLNDDYRII